MTDKDKVNAAKEAYHKHQITKAVDASLSELLSASHAAAELGVSDYEGLLRTLWEFRAEVGKL